MLPTLNGKSFLDCNEEDLQELIDNPDYRENEYIDYKAAFAFLEMDKKDPNRQGKIVEFRNDVCAFANAGGGYLIYGITDVKGMAREIVGVEIPNNNTDKFELERKNNLDCIMPKMPSLQFGYIPLKNGKFVVVIQIRKDGFAPYMHLENDTNYKAYKRVGNGKTPIGYVELKNMFNQSLTLETEIQAFRQKRIDFYRSHVDTEDETYSKFVLVHIIPDSFMDTHSRKNMFLLSKQRPDIRFHSIFSAFRCNSFPRPNVDGIRFVGENLKSEGQVYNNGIVECFLPVNPCVYIRGLKENRQFSYHFSWSDIREVVAHYLDVMPGLLDTQRVFVCVSVVGCMNMVSNRNEHGRSIGTIDRDVVMSSPIVFENIYDDESVATSKKWLQLEYYLSLGVREDPELTKLIADVSQQGNP